MSLSLSYAGPLPAPLLHPQHGPRAWGQLTLSKLGSVHAFLNTVFLGGGGSPTGTISNLLCIECKAEGSSGYAFSNFLSFYLPPPKYLPVALQREDASS